MKRKTFSLFIVLLLLISVVVPQSISAMDIRSDNEVQALTEDTQEIKVDIEDNQGSNIENLDEKQNDNIVLDEKKGDTTPNLNSDNIETENNQDNTQNQIIKSENKKSKSLVPKGVGATIAETFPDPNMAQAVATKLGTTTSHVITTTDINNATFWSSGFSHKSIQDISGIEYFVNLTYLDVSFNQITSIPEDIDNLINLNKLYIFVNEITSLPDSIGNLTNLTRIDAGSNNLNSLPKSISKLTKLSELYLDNNEFTTLPSEVKSINSLTLLYLHHNKLTELPKDIDSLQNLEILSAYDNLLTSLPDTIGNLPKLSDLVVADNQLTTLPNTIGNLGSLVILQAYNNSINSLPDSIGNMSSLQDLDLENNQIGVLPDSIGNLSNLSELYLGNSQLTSLPNSFGNLTNLNNLTLNNNLLPTNYNDKLNTLGLSFHVDYEEQRQLTLVSGLNPYEIKSEMDINNINLFNIVKLNDGKDVSSGHNLVFLNYVDENNNSIDINDYIKDGYIIKTGTVYAQVRATGEGIFPNNSDHAITVDKIQLNLTASEYTLGFNLNGGTSKPIASQSLKYGEKATPVDNPTREGYTFKGWNTAANGSGTTWDFNENTMPGNNVTLYAKWEAKDKPVPPNPKPNPTPNNDGNEVSKTGDTNNVMLFVILLAVAAVTLIVIVKKKKSKKE